MTVASYGPLYYFYGGNCMNSLSGFNCAQGLFATPLEAMVAAEAAVAEQAKAIQEGGCLSPLTCEKILEGEKAIREGRTISLADLKAELKDKR